MKAWLKGAIIGAIIGILIPIALLSLFMFSGGGGESAGLAFVFILGSTPLIVVAFAAIFSVVFTLISKLRSTGLSYTKKGFWIGLAIGIIGLFYGLWYINHAHNIGLFGFAYGFEAYDDLFYTLLFFSLSVVICTLIGFIVQKVKDKCDWPGWSRTKKGLAIGAISSITALVSWVIYIVLEGGVFTHGLDYLFGSEMGNVILGSSIFLPIILSTLIGWIAERMKSKA